VVNDDCQDGEAAQNIDLVNAMRAGSHCGQAIKKVSRKPSG